MTLGSKHTHHQKRSKRAIFLLKYIVCPSYKQIQGGSLQISVTVYKIKFTFIKNN